MDIAQLAGVGTFPFVVGITQLFKQSAPNAPESAIVGVAFGASEILSEAVAFVLHTPDPVSAALIAVGVWLMAMGTYSGGKTLIGK